jgi:hypothetical protein
MRGVSQRAPDLAFHYITDSASPLLRCGVMRGGAAPLDPGSLLTCTSLGRWSGSAGYQKHASCLDSGRAVGKDLLFYVGIALRSSGPNRASSHSVSFRPGVATQHMLEGV